MEQNKLEKLKLATQMSCEIMRKMCFNSDLRAKEFFKDNIYSCYLLLEKIEAKINRKPVGTEIPTSIINTSFNMGTVFKSH
jgi:hypothetical protein